jgi:glutathione S-transferase
MKLYDYLDSGNGYKARLLLALLGRSYELVEVDILRGETRTPSFLAINPNGRIPVLELDDGRHLSESNAILYYLAQDTPYFPADPWLQAKVQEWLCFEQYSHEPYIATLRYWIRHMDLNDIRGMLAPDKRRGGDAALAVLDMQLSAERFLVANVFTIADIALYAYTHVAEQAGFELAHYPNVQRWLGDIAKQPGYVPMFSAAA